MLVPEVLGNFDQRGFNSILFVLSLELASWNETEQTHDWKHRGWRQIPDSPTKNDLKLT